MKINAILRHRFLNSISVSLIIMQHSLLLLRSQLKPNKPDMVQLMLPPKDIKFLQFINGVRDSGRGCHYVILSPSDTALSCVGYQEIGALQLRPLFMRVTHTTMFPASVLYERGPEDGVSKFVDQFFENQVRLTNPKSSSSHLHSFRPSSIYLTSLCAEFKDIALSFDLFWHKILPLLYETVYY